ncbi:GGDEF domain-containing protein [Peteryoungia desertarenae]|uniref:diguanylate cyclase n=1 Tax=Peteryoungia desertarenae TaxID=1813451 RepID=A0ABX6QL22_9HYPH|nr:GGDEF domain-containing protein [Peteryoungia desertarenae]QLF69259.1 GGDEF domain-containing protein [Peteryoungia desertarenae]
MLDNTTLLVALGVSTICLLLTLLGMWLTRRTDRFMLTWVYGLVCIAIGTFSYSYYSLYPEPILGSIWCFFILSGFSIIYAAAHQFRTGRSPLGRSLKLSVLTVNMTTPAMLFGYDGLAFIILNLVVMILLFASAWEYWLARAEAPGPLVGIVTLYSLAAISFFLCALVLVIDGKLVLGHAPDNWAEVLNIAVSIAGMTAVGALSLMLQQARIAAEHRLEALTDALTAIPNRRALFERHGQQVFDASMALIVFDIDRFKSINDVHGHAVGDKVIRAFARELHRTTGPVTVARLGGEEFAAVLVGIVPGYAEWVAERIRRGFGQMQIDNDRDEVIAATTSAGVAYGSAQGATLHDLLQLADGALYQAKRRGRNRVELAVHEEPDLKSGATLVLG